MFETLALTLSFLPSLIQISRSLSLVLRDMPSPITLGSSNCSPISSLNEVECHTDERQKESFPHLVNVVLFLDLGDPDTTVR